jgi:predicted DNA binding protein
MYEATLRIDHESPYASITRRNDAQVELWCNQYCDLLHLTGEDLDPSLALIAENVGIKDIIHKEREVVLITEDCLLESRDDLLEEYLQRHDCLSLPPLTYDHGTLLTRVVSLSESELTAVYRDISQDHTVDVESKHQIESVVPDMPLLMLDSALPDLSEGQREALFEAIEEGYYEIPREATTADIAAKLGISRRTFEEHLRRAENKLVKNIVEYIAA